MRVCNACMLAVDVYLVNKSCGDVPLFPRYQWERGKGSSTCEGHLPTQIVDKVAKVALKLDGERPSHIGITITPSLTHTYAIPIHPIHRIEEEKSTSIASHPSDSRPVPIKSTHASTHARAHATHLARSPASNPIALAPKREKKEETDAERTTAEQRVVMYTRKGAAQEREREEKKKRTLNAAAAADDETNFRCSLPSSLPTCVHACQDIRPSVRRGVVDGKRRRECERVDCCCCPFRGRRYAFCGCSVRQNAGMKCAPANARVDIRKAI